MTTATFKTTKAELLFVMLPDGAEEIKIVENIFEKGTFSLRWMCNEVDDHGRFELPSGNWTLLGNAFQLNSEVMERVCEGFRREEGKIVDGENNQWKSYAENAEISSNPRIAFCNTVEESYASLLRKLEVFDVNPRKDEWDEVCTFGHGSDITFAEWKQLQDRTSRSWVVMASFINCKK